MKKAFIAAAVILSTFSAFTQGSVFFNNRIFGRLITHVYAPLSGQLNYSQRGNGSIDTPTGTTSWAGFTAIGGTLGGQYGAATTLSQLLAADGPNQPEGSLIPGGAVTSFRTGGAVGNIAGLTSVLNNVPRDSVVATLEMAAWDNSSGLYPSWTEASVAWQSGIIAAGLSGAFNVKDIGGVINFPPELDGLQSFNLFIVPEPSTLALAGLGSAALLFFRRAKRFELDKSLLA